MDRPKKMYKSRTNKKISGVCGGISEYFNMDPTIVRLAMFALIFVDPGFLVIYIIAALLLPEEPPCDNRPNYNTNSQTMDSQHL